MPQIDLEKIAVNGKKKFDFIPGLNSGIFAFYIKDSLHLGFATHNGTPHFDSTNGKGEVIRMNLQDLNRQLKSKQIPYALKIAQTDFLELMIEDNALYNDSLKNATAMEKVVAKKFQHYFDQICEPIKRDIDSIYSVLNVSHLNLNRRSAETSYFVLENARLYNYGKGFADFRHLSLITASKTSNDAILSAIQNGLFRDIGAQNVGKFKIHELPKEIITDEVVDTLKQNSHIRMNNSFSIQPTLYFEPKEKHKHPEPNPLQYTINFEN